MKRIIVKSLPMLGNESAMKTLKSGVKQIAKENKTKVKWAESDGQLMLDSESQPALLAVIKQLERFSGVIITRVETAFDELYLQYAVKPDAENDAQ